MTAYRFGKKDARPGAMKLMLRQYVDRSKLPVAPLSFGHDRSIKDWGMLANDRVGNCVWAGGAHEHMLWNAGNPAVHPVRFTDENVLADYAAATGFDISKTDAAGNNITDQGTDMVLAAEYRRTTGLIDAQGRRHKIAAYLALNPGSFDDLWVAAYLFGAVGVGLQMPSSSMEQFDRRQPWSYVKGSTGMGGHYLPLVGKAGNELRFVTWGRVQSSSVYFFERYCDEAVAYVTDEALMNNRSPEGFDREALIADLNALDRAA